MAKCDKKIKSDRINALKQRYDSFLEEDKKRKERNEYILEKMDKMRYCTAVVPVRNKPRPLDDYRKVPLYNKPEQILKSPAGLCRIDQRRYHIDVLSKQVDETDLLKEISKKYILIPKLPSKYSDYIKEIKPDVDDNTDWRSKYEILEQLKRNEKEGADKTLSPSERRLLEAERDVVPNTSHNINPKKQGNEPVHDYNEEFHDSGQSKNKISYDLQSCPREQKAFERTLLDESSKISNPKEGPVTLLTDDINANYSHKIFNENVDYKNDHDMDYREVKYEQNTQENENIRFDTNIDTSEKNRGEMYSQIETDTHFMQNEYKAQCISDSNQQYNNINKEGKDKMPDKEMYGDQDETGMIQTINPNELIEEINRDVPSDGQTSEPVENIQYPIEMIDVQDFTPHDDVQLEDGVNINPKPQVFENYPSNDVGNASVTEHVVVAQDVNEPIENNFDPIIVTDTTDALINEISDTGPSEYHEHVDENYAYTHESGVDDNYNAEYSAPNESYQQGEYAAYYEGVQAEQAHAQINEHEETDQRYDSNYEQQYGNTYNQESYQQQGYEQEYSQQGYEQPAYSEQRQEYTEQQQEYTEQQQEYTEQQQKYTEQQQEYTEHQQVSDQSQQEIENIQYENQNMTPQYVEQQLDNEEHYVQPQNEQIDVNNMEQQKIDDTQNVEKQYVSDKVANKVQV